MRGFWPAGSCKFSALGLKLKFLEAIPAAENGIAEAKGLKSVLGFRAAVAVWATGLAVLAGEEPKVRVSLGRLEQSVLLRGEDLKCQAGVWGRRVRVPEEVELAPEGEKIRLGREQVSAPVECRAHGPLQVSGRTYRGSLRVVGDASLVLVNVVGLEDYVAGVVNSEIPSSWPEEAVKAQAILARTYTVYRLKQPRSAEFDLEATVQDQVYQGRAVEDEAGRGAVAATRGMILTYAGQPVEAFYHSACGGRTESPEWIWGGPPKPYQQSVECGYCEDSPVYFWRYPLEGEAKAEDLGRRLGLGEPVVELKVLARSPSGRAMQIQAAGKNSSRTLSGREFREALGREAVKSTQIEIQRGDAGFVVFGSGAGHGAGMCQWGARGMAESGRTSEEILLHYFPGTEIQKLY